jgi:hypothetical protein
VETTVSTPYTASTRYEVVMKTNALASLTAQWVNGITTGLAEVDFAVKAETSFFEFFVASTRDSKFRVDNIIVCNLDVNTVAKSQSGGFAGAQRLPVLHNLPAGVVG